MEFNAIAELRALAVKAKVAGDDKAQGVIEDAVRRLQSIKLAGVSYGLSKFPDEL